MCRRKPLQPLFVQKKNPLWTTLRLKLDVKPETPATNSLSDVITGTDWVQHS